MSLASRCRVACICGLLIASLADRAGAQVFEAVGSRALGMGGAFVAVANDSSATWWNPAALGAGPFFDMGLGRATTDSSQDLPARRDRVGSYAMVFPPAGFSYYRVRVT